MRLRSFRFLRACTTFFVTAVVCSTFFIGRSQAAGFDSSRLIEDADFIAIDAMDVPAIQRFLESQGGFLKDFSENGRSAAQIVFDAAHGYGDASGNCSGSTTCSGIRIDTTTGTINPQVILTTLQKEQSLITMTTRNDNSLRAAMGYACPDSGGCNAAYHGFTKQVENAAWQLRYNFERAQGYGFGDYQVNQSFCFSDFNGTNCGQYGNRATAALYRYTPHVYNGNFNFWNMYTNTFRFTVAEYAAQATSWSSYEGSFTYPTIVRGEMGTRFNLKVKNTGKTTWQRGVVNLGTDRGRDRITPFLRESGNGSVSGWERENRIFLQENSVAPGEVGTYSFWIQAPPNMEPKTYREHFRLVADGISWFGPEIWWDVTVR